ncbi:MAG: tyrosine--tRNA ligase [Candidatus Aenigmarchaeota archaeon]|nr:tyrosine--tRNA ligase [Candidatus Aenigmarchaeota archaeon]
MTPEKRLELVRGMAEEIVTEGELLKLLQEKARPTAYDGFEPSGFAHLGSGILRAINLADLQRAGIKFKILIADWHAWINNKMGGDLEAIQKTGEYFVEVWKAAGVKKVEIIWASDLVSDEEYWKKVILVAKSTTLNRAERAVTIMGRKQGDMKDTAQIFYPMMQAADAFHLDVDIAQLGLDQRRCGILAREVAEKMGWRKPVIVSHHLLRGLDAIIPAEHKVEEGKAHIEILKKDVQGVPPGTYRVGVGGVVNQFDDNSKFNFQITSKMSKSKPDTAIFVHDTADEIKRKLAKAFCPVGVAENNPILEYNRYIVFKALKRVTVERDKKFGGDVVYRSYGEMERDFVAGKLHPMDLKASTAQSLDKIIMPVRRHFEKSEKAGRLYNLVKSSEVTR